MKKHTLFTIMLVVVAAMFTASCSKEEKKYSEEKLIGFWKIPLVVEYSGVPGKILTINPNHTAMMNDIVFNYWKLEGDELILTRDIEHGYNNHELGVMRVTVVDLTDTTMVIVGKYVHMINSLIESQGDVSGCYFREIPIPDVPEIPEEPEE